MTPSVLVTGANGFIGSHLCDAFLERGYEVFGLVRKSSDLRFLKGSAVRLLFGDLSDVDGIRFPEAVDVIVHAAALVSDNATIEQCRRHIYEITENLVERVMRCYPRLKRFVYISTALVLGCCGDGISEEHPGESADYLPYNRVKKQVENYLFDQCRKARLPIVVLRPGDVYGPRDRTSSERMLRAAEKGTPLIVGAGNRRFGLCSPTNLCRAVLAAVAEPAAVGRAYTVVNRVFPTWRDFLGALQKGVGKPQRVYVPVWCCLALVPLFELVKIVVPGFEPPINRYRIRRVTTQTTYDMSKTIEELGYESDDDYTAQFDSIVAWYRQEKGRSSC